MMRAPTPELESESKRKPRSRQWHETEDGCIKGGADRSLPHRARSRSHLLIQRCLVSLPSQQIVFLV